MGRVLATFIIGLVFGGCMGFVIAASNTNVQNAQSPAVATGADDPHEGHAMAGVEDHDGHDHSALVDATGPAPSLMMHVTKDPFAGWNIHLMTTNFTFSPAGSGGAHVDGEGHAHLYANGTKLARVYGNWFHVDKLPAGSVTLRATLNSNDHRTISVEGTAVQTAVTIENDTDPTDQK